MKKKFEFKKYNIILEIGDITKNDSDILISWANVDLMSGPFPFNTIVEEAGPQYSYTLLPKKQDVKYTDAFTTIPGMLPTSIIVTCVLPVLPEMYNDCFFKIKDTIKTYSQNNLTRYIAMSIPDFSNTKTIFHYLFLYFDELRLKELRIFVKDEKQFQILNKVLTNIVYKNSINTFFKNLKWTFSSLLKK